MICWMGAEIWTYGVVDQLVALNKLLNTQNMQMNIQNSYELVT